MWRTGTERAESAARRLALAEARWGWAPHPRQRELFASVAQVTVAACGRRWGKTECLGVDIASLALDELSRGRECRQLVVAPSDAQARLLGGEVLRLLRAAQERDAGIGVRDRQNRALALTVTRADRPGPPATVVCRTAGRDGRGLRGLWAHRIVVDEAAYVPDSVLNDVLMPMLLDKGGDYLLASSPAGRRSAFYRLFARASAAPPSLLLPSPLGGRGAGGEGLCAGGEGETTYAAFQFPTDGNPHLDLAFLHSQREEMGEAMFAQEYGAEFLDAGGAVFREDDIDAALQADDRVTLDGRDLVSDPVPGRLYTVGIDWGRKRDFTVVCVLDCTDSPARLVGLWRWQGTSWEAQIAQVAQIIARFDPWVVLADGNSIGDPLMDSLQKAVRRAVRDRDPAARVPPLERFTFGQDSKQQLVDRLNLRLAAGALTYPPHRALLTELRSFEYGPTGPSGKTRTGARPGAHDDCVCALALAVYAAPDAAPTPPAQAVLLGSALGRGRLSPAP